MASGGGSLPAIEPMPPVADLVLPWDAPSADLVADLARTWEAHGDTFVVDSGGTRNLRVFSPVGVHSFYALPESSASNGIDVAEPDRTTGIARDVILVNLGSMSNLFAALAWTIVDEVSDPAVLRQLIEHENGLAERCALQSTRIAQRSIMLRAVTRPITVDDGDQTYSVAPGASVATLLPLLNTSRRRPLPACFPTAGGTAVGHDLPMRFRFTPEQAALQQEIRAYFTELMTPELREELRGTEGVGPVPRKVARKLGADGWLGVGWPKEWGGRGLTPVEQFIFYDESMAFGAPVPVLTVNSVAPTIMQFGSDEQKQFFLPRILAGEIHFAIGYTEPDHGTDLAALETRAVRDGDEYVINGTKIFTSLASDADYIWLACRTNQEAARHKGISIIIVPTDTPGFSFTPIDSIGSFNTNYTFFEDVRVPVSNLVGPENGGWGLITNQLNHERVTICSSGIIERRYKDLLEWSKQTHTADGERILDLGWVQRNFATIRAHHEFLRLANYEIAWKAERGDPLNPADASVVKVYGSELYMQAYDLMLEIVGAAAAVEDGSPGAVLRGQIQADIRSQHVLTFGGGTNEMQRGLIAVFALGMPGSPR